MIQESPTLELSNDCFRFVSRYFEIISASSPHIYHSALTLTPRESIVQKLYKSHAKPFVRVVRGVPALWDSNIATGVGRFIIWISVWSPCNRFVAIGPENKMTLDVLDSATLQRLQILEHPSKTSSLPEALVFSPDSRTLTSFIRNTKSGTGGSVVSWDLQTGGIASAIEWSGGCEAGSVRITYSKNGRMVAVLFRYQSSTYVSIYDIVSGVHTHDVDHCVRTNPDLALESQHVYNIWTHGELLRFATPEPTGITIWEVRFTPGATPTEVETIPLPDDESVFGPRERGNTASIEFHPASCRLAFIRDGIQVTLFVWDARASKFLLRHKDADFCPAMTFSSDGRFFVCATIESELYLWKESPAGYTLLEKLTPVTPFSQSHFSPDCQSILTFCLATIQSWDMKVFATVPPKVLTQGFVPTSGEFALEFFPDRPLAITTRKGDTTVTILDLKSGAPQLTIDASIGVYGLRPIGNTVILIGDKKAIAWNLPGGNFPPDARTNVEDSTRTITFSKTHVSGQVIAASISDDLRYVALVRHGFPNILEVYCASTGRKFRREVKGTALWFPPGGDDVRRDVWCSGSGTEVFTITKDALDLTATATDFENGTSECPWGSSPGYEVMGGWILGEGGKRLLMLPPLWKLPLGVDQVWDGKFLALLQGVLPEAVVLELEP